MSKLITNMADAVSSDQGHYFVTSIAEWRTGKDLFKLISDAKKTAINVFKGRGIPCTKIIACYVPLPESAHYEIQEYLPVVKGMQIISLTDLTKEHERIEKRKKK